MSQPRRLTRAAPARRRAGWPVASLALLPCSTGVQAGQLTQGVNPAQAVQRGKTDRPAPAAAQLPNAAAREMTLFTLNLHHDREDWPGRRAYIAKELKRLAPDVIGLQEVIERRGSVENQAAWLARKLGDDCTFASVDPVGAPKRDGNALRIQRHCAHPCRRLKICTPASHTPAMLPKLVSRNVSTTRETRLRYQPRSVCASSRSDRKSP